MTRANKTVVVGMSGGVDSSVTALLLQQQGYQVIGMFMKNWEENDENGTCRASLEFQDVVRVCEQIGIPYYSVNFVQDYRERVFVEFLAELKAGLTPNPDILCNREIKFKVLLDKAIELGADYLATGHYCQIRDSNDQPQLMKGEDPSKDQSYFLYTIKSDLLKKVMFPVGGMLKGELRQLARRYQLATSEKKDSTGICFIGERNFKNFLSQYLPFQAGHFENLKGETVGMHAGVAYYTIGQRKGIGIGGAGEPWFVVGKDAERNVVQIERGVHHPALYADELWAKNLSWVSAEGGPKLPLKCYSKIRYRQRDQECCIHEGEAGQVHVTFTIPQRAITPGQSVVFYQDNCCLGGGVIVKAGLSYYERKASLPQIDLLRN